jgi:hypothetical protein
MVTSASKGTLVITYYGCHGKFSGNNEGKCGNQAGPEAIETTLLDTELGWINETNLEIGEDYKAHDPNGVMAEFECPLNVGTLHVKVTGSVIGRVTNATDVNVMSTEEKVKLAVNGNNQSPESFENAAPDVLHVAAEIPGFFKEPSAPAALALEWEINNQSVGPAGVKARKARPDKTEIRALPGASPEHGRCEKHHAGKYASASCTTLATKKGKYEWFPI